ESTDTHGCHRTRHGKRPDMGELVIWPVDKLMQQDSTKPITEGPAQHRQKPCPFDRMRERPKCKDHRDRSRKQVSPACICEHSPDSATLQADRRRGIESEG